MIDCEYMSVKLCLTRALTCGPLHISAASLDPQFSPLQALAHLPQPNLFFFRFLKCKWQWRARSQLRDVKHALWTLWHSSANCFSRTYVHAVFKAALLNLSNTFCAFRLKTHLAPWPYSFISRADVTFKCYQYLNSDVPPHTSLIPGRHVSHVYVIYPETGALTILLSQQQPQNINTRNETKPNCRLDWYLWRQLSSAKPPEAHTVTEMCLKTGGRRVRA